MNSCSCPGRGTAIRFDADVALVRCLYCDAQVWTLGGRPVPAALAHSALRGSFSRHRSRPAPVRRVAA